jgi:hypothetical protein
MVTIEVIYNGTEDAADTAAYTAADTAADTSAAATKTVTRDFALPLAVACGSDVIREAFEEAGGALEGKIPVIGVNPDTVMPYIITFLERSVEEPVKFIVCPLRSSILTDSGVPAWAEEWAWDMDAELRIAVIHAGDALRIPMLSYVVYACIAACAKILGSDVNDELLEDAVDEATGEPKVWTNADSKDVREQNAWLFSDPSTHKLNPRFPEAESLAEACASGPVRSAVDAADRERAKAAVTGSAAGAGSAAAAAAAAEPAVAMKALPLETASSHADTCLEDDSDEEDYSIADAADDCRRRMIAGQ